MNLEGPFCGSVGAGNDIPHKPNWTHADPSMVDGLTAVGTMSSAAPTRLELVPTARGEDNDVRRLEGDDATRTLGHLAALSVRRAPSMVVDGDLARLTYGTPGTGTS